MVAQLTPSAVDTVNTGNVRTSTNPAAAPWAQGDIGRSAPRFGGPVASPTALAAFAHEVRNSIGPLENALEVIGCGHAEHAVAERMLGLARRQVRQISRLLNDLLDAGQVFDGHLDLQWTEASLQDMVEESVRAWSHAAVLRGHRITLVMPEHPIVVRVDTLRIHQVLGNLLGNAIKYTLPDGHLRVAVRREGWRATVSVSDNGIGMEPEQLERVFGIFEQDPRARALSREGVGLGLAVARRLAEHQCGTLEASSAGKHMGSTFTLTLPVLEAHH